MKVREIFFVSVFSFGPICLPVWSQQVQPPPTVYLTGSVVSEDGTPLTDLGPVELVCGGRVMRQASMSADGMFVLDVSSNNRTNEVTDASVSGHTGFGKSSDSQLGSLGNDIGPDMSPLGIIDLSDCEVRLSRRAGYLSSSIFLNQRSMFDSNVGVIVVRRLDAKGGTTVSLTTLAAPEKAQKSYAKARAELGKGKPNLKKAKEELEKATQAYPEYAEAWHLLGQTEIKMRDEDLARSSFAKSFAADPKFTPPYFELIYLDLNGSRFAEAAQLSNIVLDLMPDAPRSLYIHGLSHYNLGDSSVAEESFRKIEKSGKWQEFPMVFFFLGIIDANQGEIPLAARELRTYLRITPEKQFPEGLKDKLAKQLQAWEGEGLIEAETPSSKIQN
jgi:Tfp pilus assembly protein PilF